MSQFLTEKELNCVKGLVHYLNESMSVGDSDEIAIEARLIDANGEHVGTVTVHEGGAYGLVFP